MGKLSVKLIHYGSSEYRAAVCLRELVLRAPLGLTFSKHELAKEKNHLHFGAFVGEELVASAALASEGNACKMERVAVKPEKQGLGYGAELLNFIEEEARSRGFTTIYCSSRDSAATFYAKQGYVAEGAHYLVDGIPHVIMRKILIGNISLANEKEVQEIDKKLGDFNQTMLSFEGEAETPLNYVVRKDGGIIAGISACIDWGYVAHVDLLFVDDKYRHLGLGSLLLAKVEQEAKARGAGLIQTDTFDFQAKDFYLKFGYEIFGVVDNSPRPGHKRFYLKKSLS